MTKKRNLSSTEPSKKQQQVIKEPKPQVKPAQEVVKEEKKEVKEDEEDEKEPEEENEDEGADKEEEEEDEDEEEPGVEYKETYNVTTTSISAASDQAGAGDYEDESIQNLLEPFTKE
ncbi:hypothetical protein ACFX1S_027072 [Malus domestica]